MITDKHFKALRILVDRLSNKNITWAIVGGTNFALQGVDVKAKDIDILTDKEGAFAIGEALKEFAVQPVKYSENERFNCYHGKFKIEGVDIEVMGEIENKIPVGDLWTETKGFSEKIFIEYKGLRIPVISLKQEYYAYTMMGKTEKAKKIKDVLDKK